jgi:hypothetical protein
LLAEQDVHVLVDPAQVAQLVEQGKQFEPLRKNPVRQEVHVFAVPKQDAHTGEQPW